MRKNILNVAVSGTVAISSIAASVAFAEFNLIDYGAIEDSSVSNIASSSGDNYTISFVEGSTSSSDADNVASLPSQLVIAKDADFMPDMISSVPSKDGYAFTGYYLDESMTDQLTFYEPLDSESSSVTVYVQFTPLSTYTYSKDEKEITLNGEVTLSDYGVNGSEAANDDSGLIWKESNGGGQSYTSQDINLNVKDSEISNYVELKVYGAEYTVLSSYTMGYYANSHTADKRNNANKIIHGSAHSFVLTLTQDLTIKSGGYLAVGGTIGTIGNGFLNSMDGDYFAIDLNGHTLTVEKGGTLKIHGMLLDSVGTGRVDVQSGASMYINMNALYNGGTMLTAATGFGANPFVVYGFPLIRGRVRVHSGGVLTCMLGAGASLLSQHFFAEIEIPLIGPSGTDDDYFIGMSARDEGKDSYVDYYNNMVPDGSSAQDIVNSWDSQYKSYLDFNNVSLDLNYLSFSLAMGISLNSSEYLWTFPSGTQVALRSSDIRIRQRFQLDPGMSFYADSDSNVIFSPDIKSSDVTGPASGDTDNDTDEDSDTDNDTEDGTDEGDKAAEIETSICGIVVAGEVYGALTSYTTNSTSVPGHSLTSLQDDGAATVTILGDVKFENTTTDNCFLGGQVNLSDKALNSILSAAEDGKCDLKAEGGVVYQKSGSDYAGIYYFFHLPLICNGTAYTNDHLDGSLHPLDGDLSNGIYTDGQNYYAYFLDSFDRQESIFDYSSTLRKIDYSGTDHTYTVDSGSDIEYLYFGGVSCPVIYGTNDEKYLISTFGLLSSDSEVNTGKMTWDADLGRMVTTADSITIGDDYTITITLQPGSNATGDSKTFTVKYGCSFDLDNALSESEIKSTDEENYTQVSYTIVMTDEDVSGSITIDEDMLSIAVASGDKNVVIEVSYARSSSGGGCLFVGTPVLMADGTYRPIEQVKRGDMVQSWDFFQGKMVQALVMFCGVYEEFTGDLAEVTFEDGAVLKIGIPQQILDFDTRRGMVIDRAAGQWLGHRAAQLDPSMGKLRPLKIVSIKIYEGTVDVWEVLTAQQLNFFAETGILTEMASGMPMGFYEIGDGFIYDDEAMKRDIEKYGYATRSDMGYIADLISEEEFVAFNGKHFARVFQTGAIDLDAIGQMIEEKYLNQ